VHAQDLFIYNSSDWQAVEAISESLPELDIISSFAFIVEAVDSIDGGTLVISSQDEEVLWILYLIR
jgi:hypothetical protein